MPDPCPPDCVCAGCEAAVGAAFEAELDRQDGTATLRAQLAEARAEADRLRRERDEAQWALQQYEMNRTEILYEDTQRARDMHRRAQAAESLVCRVLRHGRAYAIRQGESMYWRAFFEREGKEAYAALSNEYLRAVDRAEQAERERDEARAELAAERGRREAAERVQGNLRAALDRDMERYSALYEKKDSAEARARGLAATLRALVDSLPRCDFCDRLATRAWKRGDWRYCDAHGKDVVPEYPRAKALREAQAALAAAEGGEGR
jgi:hypothetical protein